jgi:ABC-type lipoprotein export system ATPase subunit
VLDEPSSQLDEGTVDVMAAVLRRTADNGHTVIVATHDPVLTLVADNITELELLTA